MDDEKTTHSVSWWNVYVHRAHSIHLHCAQTLRTHFTFCEWKNRWMLPTNALFIQFTKFNDSKFPTFFFHSTTTIIANYLMTCWEWCFESVWSSFFSLEQIERKKFTNELIWNLTNLMAFSKYFYDPRVNPLVFPILPHFDQVFLSTESDFLKSFGVSVDANKISVQNFLRNNTFVRSELLILDYRRSLIDARKNNFQF